jgi:NADP-dependent aldehyde dehydrogenase
MTSTTAATAATAPGFAATAPRQRATALLAIADALTGAEEELVPLAASETALADGRLRGELKRTAVQLRLFADVCAAGDFLDVRIDDADPEFVLGPRPDLRRYLIPVGPVLNFAASNFPFAFSVAGGDTAAALAAGCPVVVKAHPGHPKLSDRTAEIVRAALVSAGLPADVLGLIHGQDAGVEALRDERIAAASFTGSFRAGQALARIAAGRERPIPFYGEMGSVNPVVVTPAALAARASQIAAGYIGSVTGSAGQLCTKPGFLFVPVDLSRSGASLPGASLSGASLSGASLSGASLSGASLSGASLSGAAAVGPHRLLHAGIVDGYVQRRAEILATPGVRVLVEGVVTADGASPTLVETDLDNLLAHRDSLLDEAFGPLSVVVRYRPDQPLAEHIAALFEGSLTATVHTGADEDSEWLRALVTVLRELAGRVLFNGWPTGVAVTPAMQHGGPFPATTNETTTSVGTAAIARFLRPVTYQDCPPALLPEPLRDDNPWGVPQRRSRAGESAGWGGRA